MCYVVESQLELWKKTLKFQVFVMEWASERIEVKNLAGDNRHVSSRPTTAQNSPLGGYLR
jgi:hypothetical protein